MITPLSAKSFSSWMIQQAATYGLTYGNSIPDGNDRYVRGFKGIRACGR